MIGWDGGSGGSTREFWRSARSILGNSLSKNSHKVVFAIVIGLGLNRLVCALAG